MRILVDTSVWSLALRRKDSSDNREAEILKRLIEEGEEIYLIGIILQEILQGVRKQKDFKRLREYFEPFPIIEIRREDYIKAAQLKNHLISKGIQISTINALIATTAINYRCILFTADSGFTYIAKHTSLKLLKY
jgi:hypothetical protein